MLQCNQLDLIVKLSARKGSDEAIYHVQHDQVNMHALHLPSLSLCRSHHFCHTYIHPMVVVCVCIDEKQRFNLQTEVHSNHT